MLTKTAYALATSWIRAHGAEGAAAQDSYNALHAELMGLLPDSGNASVSVIDGLPTIVVVDATTMYSVSADAAEEESDAITWRFRCSLRSLQAGRPRITLVDEVRAIGGLTKRHRTWEFQLSDGDKFTINGSEAVRGGFAQDRQPDNDEQTARAVAKGAGWQLPDPDESPAQYQ
jgi:hypothetical protein